MLTFEAFLATRREVDDLEKALGFAVNDDGIPVAGLIYVDDLFIEKGNKGGLYHLQIANGGWVDTDLAALERELYAFYLDERCESTPAKDSHDPSP